MGTELSGLKKKKKVRTTDFATSTFPIPSVAKCGENYSLPKVSLSTLNEIINRKYMQSLGQWKIKAFVYKSG